jgi:hypothetical protein
MAAANEQATDPASVPTISAAEPMASPKARKALLGETATYLAPNDDLHKILSKGS